MPYIEQERRDALELVRPSNVGELNYTITRLVDDYLDEFPINYATINSVIGVLECAKLELYRRIAAPYEEQKRFENGEVYGTVEKL